MRDGMGEDGPRRKEKSDKSFTLFEKSQRKVQAAQKTMTLPQTKIELSLKSQSCRFQQWEPTLDRPYQSSLGTKINWYCPDLADGFAVFHHGTCIHYKKDTILQNLWVHFFLPSANICWARTRSQVGSMILPHGWSTSKKSASPQPSSWCFWKDWLGFFWPSGPPFRSICYFILIGHLNIVVGCSIYLNGVLIKSELNL